MSSPNVALAEGVSLSEDSIAGCGQPCLMRKMRKTQERACGSKYVGRDYVKAADFESTLLGKRDYDNKIFEKGAVPGSSAVGRDAMLKCRERGPVDCLPANCWKSGV